MRRAWCVFDLGALVHLGLDGAGFAVWCVCSGSAGADDGEGKLHIALCHGLFQVVCYQAGFAYGSHRSPTETTRGWNAASWPREPGMNPHL